MEDSFDKPWDETVTGSLIFRWHFKESLLVLVEKVSTYSFHAVCTLLSSSSAASAYKPQLSCCSLKEPKSTISVAMDQYDVFIIGCWCCVGFSFTDEIIYILLEYEEPLESASPLVVHVL